jgi:pyruvate/2-oxoglutarate dehydrogenase complex dihydrolipoamide acyltransferase (E2) component
MASEIIMPPLSQTTDEVRLLDWLVKKGDQVKRGDPLCEVETDKVSPWKLKALRMGRS